MNVLLTGKPGCGKTTVCGKVVGRLEDKGFRCGGIICPEVKESGGKVGSNVMDVRTKEQAIMARLNCGVGSGGIKVGRYSLRQEGIEFGRNAIENASGCDVIAVDEIGLVELEDNGLMDAASKALNSGNTTIVIVRSRLKEEFLGRFKGRDFMAFDVTEENRGTLPEEISRRIEDDCRN